MGKDYYKVLGVNKTATQEEIKKSFREKAHQYHPDKQGGDEAKFKEINEAYQVLGNSDKRSQYDRFGSSFENAQSGGGFSGFDGFRDFSGYANGFSFDMDDLGDILGGFGDMFGFGGNKKSRRAKQGRDLEMTLTIDFMEAVFGTEKEINLEKKVKCPHCHGNAAEPGSKIETCKACGGAGRVTRMQRTILGNMQVQMTCEACSGEGKSYTQKCSKCGGAGVAKEKINFKVKIPAGIDNGESIRLSGQGEAGERSAQNGDLYLKIKVASDKRFTRDGYDIKTKAEISFKTAALGGKVKTETVDGPMDLKIPAGTQSGTTFRLKGEGINRLREGRGRGDHFIEIIIKTPTSLTKKQKQMLEEIDL